MLYNKIRDGEHQMTDRKTRAKEKREGVFSVQRKQEKGKHPSDKVLDRMKMEL